MKIPMPIPTPTPLPMHWHLTLQWRHQQLDSLTPSTWHRLFTLCTIYVWFKPDWTKFADQKKNPKTLALIWRLMPLRPWNSVIKSGMKHIKVNGDYYHANFARFPESETISEKANFLLFLMQNPKMHNRSPLNTHQTNEKKSSILLFIYVTTVCVCVFVCASKLLRTFLSTCHKENASDSM